MRDGPLRRVLKGIALGNFVLGTTLTRATLRWRRQPVYVLGGACRRNAACCEAPAVQVGRAVWYVPTLRRLFLWWQEKVNGFVPTGRDVPQRVFVFRCTHFDRGTRSCDSYSSRPGMCRDYPRVLLHQAHPQFLPGCGYRAIAPNAARLLEALRQQPLAPEQRARLARDLHLEVDGE